MSREEVADVAASVGLGALAGFCVLTLCVFGDGGPLFTDGGLHAWCVAHRPDMAVALARGLTATGTGVVPYALAVLAGIVAVRTPRHRLPAAGLAVLCLASGQAVRYGVMTLAARARPPRADWATHASGWAFPSGHTTTAALAAGLLISAICLRDPRGRTLLAAAAGCWGALVGLTRVYLGVHWFTDVVGGWLLAIGWLGLLLCIMAWWLPDRFLTGPAHTPIDPTEDHAHQDPGRGGRSHPA
ncbi:phosphatase PAP2 family protein [Streptomyces sp. NPDC006309]|uniref:phosphatase PAP2 family protein n=1 Tax=Streptomyces sp. NPDC006309 TaxID=3156749 RepID=UPI00339FD145